MSGTAVYFISEVGAGFADIGQGAFGLWFKFVGENVPFIAATLVLYAIRLQIDKAHLVGGHTAGRPEPRPQPAAGTRSAPIGGRLIAPLRNVSTDFDRGVGDRGGGLRLEHPCRCPGRCCTESTPPPARWVMDVTHRDLGQALISGAGHPRELVRRGRSGRRPPRAPEDAAGRHRRPPPTRSPPARHPGVFSGRTSPSRSVSLASSTLTSQPAITRSEHPAAGVADRLGDAGRHHVESVPRDPATGPAGSPAIGNIPGTHRSAESSVE